MQFYIKLLCLLLFLSFMEGKAAEESNLVVTVDVKQKNLSDILTEVARQTGINFIYDSSIIAGIRLDFKAYQEPLLQCMKRLIKDIPITYYLSGNNIILKRANEKVTISGFIRDKNTLEYLVGASVYDHYSRRGTTTNENGFFSLTLSSKVVELEISYVGYRVFKQTFIELNKDTVMRVSLIADRQLEEVVIVGTQSSKELISGTQMGTLSMTQKSIKNIPTIFGEADVVKALQTQPGVMAGVEGFSGMYVRGGNGDDNLYLIDGVPVYQVSHLGGLFSAFNAEAVEKVDFFKSAFPARYGGRLSSVVDIRTKDGNMKEFHGSAMLGLISGNLNLSGPIIKDRTSFNISLRRSWLDVLSAPAIAIYNKVREKEGEKMIGRYAFTDLNFKVNHFFSEKSRAYVSLYLGQDFLKGGNAEFSKGDGMSYENKDIGRLRWGNVVTSAGWSYIINNKIYIHNQFSYSRYRSSLKRTINEISGEKGSVDYSESLSESSSINGIEDLGVRSSWDYLPLPEHHVRFGTSYFYHRFKPEYVREKRVGDIEKTNPVNRNETLLAHEFDLYIEDDWSLGRATRLNAGLRLGLFNVQKKSFVSLDPRLSARFLLYPDFSFKLSYARMNQYVHQINESYISLPTDLWLPVSRDFKPLTSDQISAGFYYNLRDLYSFSVEGYYKWMNHILDYKDGYNFLPSFIGWEEKLVSGKGWAYGLDLIVRKNEGNITGWIGYGLMWADRQISGVNGGIRFPAKYDNRHKLNIVINWKINKKIELTGSWVYMTGNRITLALENYQDLKNSGIINEKIPNLPSYWERVGIDYYANRNNFRLPAYHRLDLGINIYSPKKRGRMGIWNISIYNVYSYMSPIAIRKWYQLGGYNYSKAYCSFQTLGLLPVIPSFSYTYKF